MGDADSLYRTFGGTIRSGQICRPRLAGASKMGIGLGSPETVQRAPALG